MREPDFLPDYRPNVGICLFNRKGQVWLGKRAGVDPANFPGADVYIWQMPQGGIDDDEDVIRAGLRELEEETGVVNVRLLTVSPGWLVYDFPEGYSRKKKKRWLGQRQKWVAMLFEGKDSEINLETSDNIEFEDWRWADIDEAPQLVVPFKRGVYEEVVTSFSPLVPLIHSLKG